MALYRLVVPCANNTFYPHVVSEFFNVSGSVTFGVRA